MQQKEVWAASELLRSLLPDLSPHPPRLWHGTQSCCPRRQGVTCRLLLLHHRRLLSVLLHYPTPLLQAVGVTRRLQPLSGGA